MQRDDQVQNPKHYDVFEDLTAIEIIACSMSLAEFRGFCKGNSMKYRLRAGSKGVGCLPQDIAKAENYKDIFQMYRSLCRDEVEDVGDLLNPRSEGYNTD